MKWPWVGRRRYDAIGVKWAHERIMREQLLDQVVIAANLLEKSGAIDTNSKVFQASARLRAAQKVDGMWT